MLQIIQGRSGSGKTKLIHDRICSEADTKDIVLLVPEQSSFNNEKRILDTLGAKNAAKVSVTTFRHLFVTLSELYGGNTRKRIDEGVKTVLMSLAVEEVSDQLDLYAARSRRADFAELMAEAVNEYKMCAISPEELLQTSLRIENPRLRDKVRESALIYSAYEALLHTAYSDPDDDMKRLYELLLDHHYFYGKTVYIDSFNGFSGQEMKVLECILSQADYVGISVCSDKVPADKIESSIFREPATTILRLRALAEKTGTEIAPPVILSETKRYHSSSLAALESSVFRYDGEPHDWQDDAVQLYIADDEYDEVRQAARTICRLTRCGDYAFRDITVICRDTKSYSGIIESEFPKYQISYFLSQPQPLEEKPLIRLMLTAFDVVHSSFRTESILQFLKTGLTPLKRYEISKLENYVYIWNIKGSRWKSPFTMNPGGNREMTEQDEKDLAELETVRQKAITPLMDFAREISKAADGAAISKAVFILLEKLNTSQRIKQITAQLQDMGNYKEMETEIRIWDIAMNMLDKMHTVLGDKAVDSRRYCELLKLMIRKNPISDIPQTLDQVTIGTAGNIRCENPRAVLIIGALEGVFPAVPAVTGLFSDSERNTLISLSLPLYDTLYGTSLKEKFNAYCAITAPTDRLYVSCHSENVKGEECLPSVIFREIGGILKNTAVRYHSDIPDEELFFTAEQSFEECTQHWNENTPRVSSLKDHFSTSERFRGRYAAVERAANDEVYKLMPDVSKKLFHEKLRLSPSQVEKYYNCPFAYFCEYGLRAYPRMRVDQEPFMYGSIAHYVLEGMLKNEGFHTIASLDDDGLLEVIRHYIEQYMESIGGQADRTKRFMAQFRSMEQNILVVVKRLIDEFSQSRFVPSDYELEIDENGQIPQYELLLPDGEKLTVVGKVDRVDTYIKKGADGENDQKYIRIVDYKTGVKEFRLSDVLYGLNIQMLFYLSAIQKNGADYYSDNGRYSIAPAGILYMPSTPDTAVGDVHSGDAVAQERAEEKRSLKMNGLLIRDLDVLNAMEKNVQGIYIPAKLKSNGTDYNAQQTSVVSLESYGRIFAYIDKMFVEMAQSLLDGRIERMPAVTSSTKNACQYCSYSSVCGFEEGKAYRKLLPYKDEEAEELIRKKVEDNG